MTSKTFVLTGSFFSEQPLATCSKDLNDREGGSGKPTPIPHTNTAYGRRLFFPATGIRGKLRRSARDVIRDSVIARTGKATPFSIEQHYLLTLGGVKSSGSESKSSVAHDAFWRQKNPLLSVFGAGAAGVLGFMAGHLSVGNAICKDDVTEEIFSGARTDEFYRDRQQVSYLSPSDIKSLVMQAEGNRDSSTLRKELKAAEAAAKKAKRQENADVEQAALADITRLTAELESVQEESGASAVSVGMPLAGWKAIPQGQTLEQRMFLQRSNEIELGLLLASLNRFAMMPILGAHTGYGCGMVSGEWSVSETTTSGIKRIGSIRLLPFDRLEIEGEALTSALAAFEQFLATDGDFRIPTIEMENDA